MKKLFLSLAVLCGAVVAQAQVISGYDFTASFGTYTEITDGIVMDTVGITGLDEYEDGKLRYKGWFPDSIANDETVTLPGFPIGFDFEFNDKMMNQFAISSTGYIALGRDEVTLQAGEEGWIMTRDYEDEINAIGAAHKEAQTWLETTEVSYKLEGEAPNRVLVVQFKDLPYGLDWSGESLGGLNSQIRLYETTNRIEIIFGALNVPEGKEETSKDLRTGLRGTGEDRLIIGRPDWDNEYTFDQYIAEPGGTGTMGVSATNLTSGLTYTFDIPAECTTPVEAVSGVELNSTTLEIFGQFTATTDADKYLILLTEGEATEAPVDGTLYSVLDSIGNSVVMTFDAEDTITMPYQIKLKASTEYTVTIVPTNSLCSGGPLYGTAVTGKVNSKPGVATSVTVTGTELNSLTFDVVANETNNVMVLLSDSIRTNRPYANVREFGNPQGELAVGDLVDGLSRVVYMGGSAEGVVVEDLEPGTAYFLRAISYDADYNYATEVVEDRCATVSTLPWKPDLTNEDLNDLPAGWKAGGQEKAMVNSGESGYGVDAMKVLINISQNPETGALNTLSFGRFLISERDAAFSFTYNQHIWQRFGGNKIYEWEANDTLAVQIRRDGGDWENIHTLTAENRTVPEVVTDFISVEADLTDYVNETIEIRLYWNCFASQGVRFRAEQFKAEGRPIPVIPVVTVSDITWNSANVTWRSEQETYEFAYAVAGEEFATRIVSEKAVALTDLTHLTDYQVKVRGIVAEGDTTEWSEVVEFTTADLPECPIPTDLTHVATEDYGDKLTWSLDEEHISWDLRYRQGTDDWTDVEGLETNEYSLYNLVPGATYLWRVRAHCDMDRVSGYASQETFTANQYTAISAATAESFNVVALNGAINVYNNGALIQSVTLVDVNGRVINHVELNTIDNILIPVNVNGVVLVRVNTVDNQFVYKVSVK